MRPASETQMSVPGRWSRRQLALLCLGWIVAHMILAAVLDTLLWPTERPRGRLPLTSGLWAAVAIVVQTPFLLVWRGSKAGWPKWVLVCTIVPVLSFMVIMPFAAGVTFALCRGAVLDSPTCSQTFLLVSLIPMGLLVGVLQWRLLRRTVRRAGWLPLAQLAGVVAFTLTFTAVRYDSWLFDLDRLDGVLGGSPHLVAGLAYGLVVLPALLGLRRRGTVSRSTVEEPTDDERDPSAGPP